MDRTVYLNGAWVAEGDAKVSVFDRGFLFADAIYEVTAIIHGKLVDYPGHLARLKRSLDALGIAMPVAEAELLDLHKEIARRNGIQDGLIYLQVSRGVQDRDFVFPEAMEPTFVMFTQTKKVLDNPKWKTGLSVKTVPEGRWSDRQIKTVQLLYSSLRKTEANRQGYDDVLFVENGHITEASSANFHIVTQEGVLVTRDLSNALLHGITRGSILHLARQADLKVEERAFTPEEAKAASEAFVTSATSFVTPVVKMDGVTIGNGEVGPISRRLLDIYIREHLSAGIPIAG
ncbi:D-amino-acid transaminase [Rhizobium rhizogenes]|uniref:Probable branched-chain-amino-acid aminotransferase n=1 Tax=Rhizobium rhizogenes TaxID=359 RepID=A0AA92C4M4_RHIRH|nr:D-amino-acid transaminase [Rhizobium rhizogenes]KQR30609.1 D-amino acid aminotransferase [Rhizobium sp. Leaf155]PVE55001.1 D-amino-acid transaminase [Rhizobium rhizogenes]PVE67555.1 D-amino-acid transaminase [Agrobacterium tumefaciens]PVE77332.1 D-amino-acid transaminase [Sphingomonas sp. TPD3009]